MTSFTIIGVDPGDSTGVAVVQNGALTNALQLAPRDAVIAIELTIERAKAVQFPGSITVACERYIQAGGRSHQTHQPTAQRMAGIVMGLADRYGVPLVWQSPADAWAVADNETLRKIGWYTKRGDVDRPDALDVNMAVRHALLCLARLYATVFESLVEAGPDGPRNP